MTIKNLVLTGGGPHGLCELGAVSQLIKKGVIDLNKIEKIYGTSVGGVVAVVLSLGYDMEYIYDYYVTRPWEKAEGLDIETDDILEIFTCGGFLDKFFEFLCKEVFFKFCDVKGLCKDITLKDFYEKTGKELYLYTIELSNFETVELSYKSHPDMTLVKAVQMSSSLPPVFKPIEYECKLYMDGGAIHNYPLDYCLKDNNPEETYGITFDTSSYEGKEEFNMEKMNVPLYYMFLFNKFFNLACTTNRQTKIKNEINIPVTCGAGNMTLWKEFFTSVECRQELWNRGIECVNTKLEIK